jgi:hypothetical protein
MALPTHLLGVDLGAVVAFGLALLWLLVAFLS